ncbi:hypothetical protein [Microvirga sp. TS319]|uniref:hypothetical protein n=1 Tax=Microvirga sp. TS319 TaxID=3241165 RepID=UPI00351A81C5
MKAVLTATMLAIALAASPALSQQSRDPFEASGEIRIPSQEQLEREVFTQPRNDFSSIDTVADGEMDRMDRRIDSLVDRGICSGC